MTSQEILEINMGEEIRREIEADKAFASLSPEEWDEWLEGEYDGSEGDYPLEDGEELP